jgi:FkbM family methyltransferase
VSIEGLIEQFQWTAESESRNDLTSRYEPIQPFILLALARRLSDAVLVDVGANIGFYAVTIGNEPTVSEVHAFEPMPAAAAATRENTTTNLPLKQVAIHQLALSDQQGHLEFAVRGPLAGDNGALTDSILDASQISVDSVPCSRLDEVLQISGRHLVIKVDVEGHELSMLHGAVGTLSANQGFLQVEMHESPSDAEKVALLNGLDWHLITRVGPDHYFSNIPEYYETRGAVTDVFEEAMSICLDTSKSPQRASRRRIVGGVYLQVSRSQVQRVKATLGKLGLRRETPNGV